MGRPGETLGATVIGLEVHAQLLTRSKMYCGCSARYADAAPNRHVCQVCGGFPGALPVLNRAAIESGILTGIALSCEIPGFCKLDRKNYVYPDLPKGYQISQYDLPLCVGGSLSFVTGGEERRAGITRVHVEEDTGRLLHRLDDQGRDVSLVDLNRSGVPLMEIVGEPDLRSPAEARDYLIALRQILRYIGVSTGNMEEGAFRCDANVSIRDADGALGTKVEIKNMNSFSAVFRALRYEAERQRALLDAGQPIEQETRGWVESRGVTAAQRTKEQAHDYRYFPEPDLPPLVVSPEMVREIQRRLPELPAVRRQRLAARYGLDPETVILLTSEREIADLFEETVGVDGDAAAVRIAANWIANDLLGLQRARGLPAEQLPLNAPQLRDLLGAVASGELTARAAKEVLPRVMAGDMPRAVAARLNLLALDDDSAVREAVAETLVAFPAAVADYQAGKKAAIGRLIGETIKRTGGRAKPEQVRRLIEESLDGASEGDP
ncbi:MAG: Asp-tRNA(Asn)/Glu-tRNA(Gln) amidotransferase subunit GatB [Chloroflexota bacterium]|nr:Asp-tRNA(Asn)/Glu-tRNA(Gln) amidotransferase subunit GatB [Chloroflexia bacterium]MDQ3467938.1 Asp-tRNA(Asn)/Glu-tRNA(Gln) amidotransferase subunit GatB [Chloroflexota bacterium]